MFGTLGFSELILILAIVFIIFGAGRLPQLGEGLGKALKGFKKEVHEAPPVEPDTASPPPPEASSTSSSPAQAQATGSAPSASPAPTAPYRPGPELTPGTTAALMAAAAPQPAQPKEPPRSNAASTSPQGTPAQSTSQP